VARVLKKMPAAVRAWKSNSDRTTAIGCSSELDVHPETRCAVVRGALCICNVLTRQQSSTAVSGPQEVARSGIQNDEPVRCDRSCVHGTSAFLLEVGFTLRRPPRLSPHLQLLPPCPSVPRFNSSSTTTELPRPRHLFDRKFCMDVTEKVVRSYAS
jgi:hypothetical protein